MASTPFMIIQTSKMVCIPGIQPMVNGETLHIKDVQKCIDCHPLGTQKNTMSPLSYTMMFALFIDPLKHLLCFMAYILNESHLHARPLGRVFQREAPLACAYQPVQMS